MSATPKQPTEVMCLNEGVLEHYSSKFKAFETHFAAAIKSKTESTKTKETCNRDVQKLQEALARAESRRAEAVKNEFKACTQVTVLKQEKTFLLHQIEKARRQIEGTKPAAAPVAANAAANAAAPPPQQHPPSPPTSVPNQADAAHIESMLAAIATNVYNLPSAPSSAPPSSPKTAAGPPPSSTNDISALNDIDEMLRGFVEKVHSSSSPPKFASANTPPSPPKTAPVFNPPGVADSASATTTMNLFPPSSAGLSSSSSYSPPRTSAASNASNATTTTTVTTLPTFKRTMTSINPSMTKKSRNDESESSESTAWSEEEEEEHPRAKKVYALESKNARHATHAALIERLATEHRTMTVGDRDLMFHTMFEETASFNQLTKMMVQLNVVFRRNLRVPVNPRIRLNSAPLTQMGKGGHCRICHTGLDIFGPYYLLNADKCNQHRLCRTCMVYAQTRFEDKCPCGLFKEGGCYQKTADQTAAFTVHKSQKALDDRLAVAGAV